MGLLMMMATPLVDKCQHRNDQLEWSAAFSLPADETGHSHLGLAGPLVGVHRDILFIGGGANFPNGMPWKDGQKHYHQILYTYENTEGETTNPTASIRLPFAIAYGANCNTPEGLVVAGGENQTGLLSKVLLLSWDKKTKTPKIRQLPDLPFSVTNASLTAVGNILYLAGGERQNTVSNLLLSLSLKRPNQGWEVHTILPYAVSHACLVAQNNGLYLIGGRKRNTGGVSDFYDEMWHYDITKREWQEKTPLPKPLSAATAIADANSSILLIGGDNGSTFQQVERLLAEIARETDSQRSEVLNEQKNTLLTSHPGFEKTVWCYDIDEDCWQRQGTIPFSVPVTTTAVPWLGDICLPSGEIRAGIRSPDVLVGKWQKTAAIQKRDNGK